MSELSEHQIIMNHIHKNCTDSDGYILAWIVADWHMAEVARYKDEIALLNKIIRGEDGAICANGGE